MFTSPIFMRRTEYYSPELRPKEEKSFMCINLFSPLLKSSNVEIYKKLHKTVNSLFPDIKSINPVDLKISEYNQQYLKTHKENLLASLHRYAYILGESMSMNTKSLPEICFIEYGGGTGFLSLLAKKLGIGMVIYNDVYDVSCKDAREIGKVLGCEADYYVEGNINDLILFCTNHEIKCDIMDSYDVIEHIYDIDDFLRKLKYLANENTVMFHASGCNMFFYPYVRETSKAQKHDENNDRQKVWGWKERDSIKSYLNERKELVKSYRSDLKDDEIIFLAKNTRGLMNKDILTVVDNYMVNKQPPILIEHPTNTCDPNTGNWSEHLVNPYYLAETLTSNGFIVNVVALPWCDQMDSQIKKITVKVLNQIHIAKISLYFSSGYGLFAKFKGTTSKERHKYHMYKYNFWWYCFLPFNIVFNNLYSVTKRMIKASPD